MTDSNDQPTCRYCNAPMNQPAQHHADEHPRKRFDPLWYVESKNPEEASRKDELVSDLALDRAFANSNFGDRDHREVLRTGLVKVLGGWATGHTISEIMNELCLIQGDADRPNDAQLTNKGKQYLALDLVNDTVVSR